MKHEALRVQEIDQDKDRGGKREGTHPRKWDELGHHDKMHPRNMWNKRKEDKRPLDGGTRGGNGGDES